MLIVAAGLAVLAGLIQYADHRRPVHLWGTALGVLTLILLLLPSMWIIRTVIALGWQDTIGPTIIDWLYRPNRPAIVTYSALTVASLLLAAAPWKWGERRLASSRRRRR